MADEFAYAAAATLLRQMFKKDSFSICDLDAIAKALDIPVRGPDYDALRCLHCVNYKDMPPGLPLQLQQKVLNLLQNPFNTVETDAFISQLRNTIMGNAKVIS